jgi:type II secretory pathway pseudopilin PulG
VRIAAPRLQHHAQAGERGFSIVELIVSLGVLITGAAAGLSLMVGSMYATSFASTAQTAARVGQDVLDRTMMELYDSLGGSTSACQVDMPPVFADGTIAAHWPTDVPSGQTAPAMTFRRSCNVAATAGMKLMTTTVRWSDGGGKPRSITLGVQRAR